MNKINTGNFIRQKRIDLNLTQEELADKLGVNNKTISRWECGVFLPPVDKLFELSKLFQTSIDDILNGVESDDKSNINSKNEDTVKYIRLKSTLRIVAIISIIISFFSFIVIPNLQVASSIAISIVLLLLIRIIKKEKIAFILSSAIRFLLIIISIVFSIINGADISHLNFLVLIYSIGILFIIIYASSDTVYELFEYNIVARIKYNEKKLYKNFGIAFSIFVSCLSIFSATLANISGITRYKVGTYAYNNIEEFLKDQFVRASYSTSDYYNPKDYDIYRELDGLKDILKTISFNDDKNIFPYSQGKIELDDGSIDGSYYTDLVITSRKYTFRMNDDFTRVTLVQNTSTDGNIIYECEHHYTCDASDGVKLRDYIIQQKEGK